MFKLLFSPLRLVRLGIRIAGLRNFTLIAIGIGIGLLIAPKPGAQFRQELSSRLEQRRGTGPSAPGPAPVRASGPAGSPVAV